MSTRSSKDRASLCLFAFKDGRRCRMPRAVDPYLCNFHARREAEQAARQRIGRNISDAFSGDYISASGLSLALARTLAATAQGQPKPKQAALIACLGRTLLQAIPHARDTNTFKPSAPTPGAKHPHLPRFARRISATNAATGRKSNAA
jgi:hypothetical protein